MSGKMQRPRTEPMYSGGNRVEFPVTSEYNTVHYTDFIYSRPHYKHWKTNDIPKHAWWEILCHFSNVKTLQSKACPQLGNKKKLWFFSGICWRRMGMEEWKVKGDIFLPCDENFGFGVYLMEKYGRNQTILSGTANIQKNWDEGIEITACAAWECTFYITMTKDTLLKREELKDLHFCILRGFLLSVLWFLLLLKKWHEWGNTLVL